MPQADTVQELSGKVRVETRSETGTSSDHAYVRVYEDDRLVVEVIATVELMQGADGGYYHCVELKKRQG